jgi:hypothetical protein
MAENKRGVQYGGPWRYGWQPGMTNDPDELTILRYTNPLAAEAYEALQEIARSRRKPNE